MPVWKPSNLLCVLVLLLRQKAWRAILKCHSVTVLLIACLYLFRGRLTADVCRAAREKGRRFCPTENFISRSDNSLNAVRICIKGEHGLDHKVAGMRVLADLWQNPVERTLAQMRYFNT
jgi:hypothetical protein